MKKLIIYLFIMAILVTTVLVSRESGYYAVAGIAKIGLFLVFSLGGLNLFYYLLPFRTFKKVRAFALFPKYYLEIKGNFESEHLTTRMLDFGYKKISSEKNCIIFSHGFLVGDFSVKFAQHFVKCVPGDGKMDIYVYHYSFVLFDTGDFSKIISELKQKLSQA